MQDDVTASGRINLCDLAKGYSRPFSVLKHEVAGCFGVPSRGVVENDGHIKNAIALERLGNVGSLICRLHGIHDGHGLKSKLKEAFGLELHNHFRQSRLGFDLHIGRSGNRRYDASDILSHTVNLIEIFAEDFDRHLSPDTGQDLLDAFSEEWLDREIHSGKFHQRIANLRLNRLGFFPTQRNKIDIDFAVVRSPCVIRLLRASHALGHRADVWTLVEFLCDFFAQSQFRQERTSKKRQHRKRAQAQRRDSRENRLRVFGYAFQSGTVSAFQISNVARRAIDVSPFRQERQTQSRRDRQRNEERCQDREDVSDSQRRK